MNVVVPADGRRVESPRLRLGAVFPQGEIGPDPVSARDFAQAAEALGYDHLLVYDHVVGVDAARHPGWRGGYDYTDTFYEPLVLFGYLFGVTTRLELATGILILPQRQTALVAKQAATIDYLSGGRLRLGVGVGWNRVEYEALGTSFEDRGQRIEEQIEVLRALWTQPVISYQGRWHAVSYAGINPLPVQRPIPIWIGGATDRVLRRTARVGDGWIVPGLASQVDELVPLDSAHQPSAADAAMPRDARSLIARLQGYVRDEARDPTAVGIEKVVGVARRSREEWARIAVAWREAGATHLSVDTSRAGLATPDDHIRSIRLVAEATQDLRSRTVAPSTRDASTPWTSAGRLCPPLSCLMGTRR